jgi:hypothetical protein
MPQVVYLFRDRLGRDSQVKFQEVKFNYCLCVCGPSYQDVYLKKKIVKLLAILVNPCNMIGSTVIDLERSGVSVGR